MRFFSRVWLSLLIYFSLLTLSFAWVNDGSWSISGNVTDVRLTLLGNSFTNTLTVSGFCDRDHFLIDLTPIKTEDEIAESVGWDGDVIRLIQRFPEMPRKKLPRNQSIA